MKYVVEFEDVPCLYEDGMAFYRCKQDLSCHISQHTINSLTTSGKNSPSSQQSVGWR